jgi:hypothetical protein
MVGAYRVFERGLGWVDVHLLASAMLDQAPLWTLDRRLAGVVRELGVGWTRPL